MHARMRNVHIHRGALGLGPGQRLGRCPVLPRLMHVVDVAQGLRAWVCALVLPCMFILCTWLLAAVPVGEIWGWAGGRTGPCLDLTHRYLSHTGWHEHNSGVSQLAACQGGM